MTTTIENKIAKSIEEQKLPALTGSVKQIAWATDIRAKKLARLDDMIAKIQSNVSDDAQHRKNQIAYQAARNVLCTKVESRFWIDNRFVDGTKLLAANNLQDAFKAEFERLCKPAEVKAEVKAEEKPAEVKAEVKAEEKPAEVKAEVKVETDDTKMTTTTTNDATKLYKVFAINQDGIHECKSKLNIIVGESRISAFMTVDCKTLKSACCNFHKALEQAVADGVLDAKIPQFGKFADTDAIDFGAEDSVTFSDVNDSYAYGIDDFSDYDHGYYFWFWVKIDAISAEVKAKVKAEAKAETKAETDGSEDDPDDNNDVFNYLPAIDDLNDVDTTQTKDEMKAAADQMGLMQLNRKIADLEEQLIDNRLAATAVLNEITDDTTTFAEQKEIERRYSKYAAISDALIDEKAIYKAAKSTRLSQITAIKNLMSKNQNTQANNEHKPEKSVSNPLEYWVSNYYGNFAKRKKLTHPRGKKFYFVDWDRTNYRNYWLTYTRDADEDKLLLDDQQHIWVKISRSDAIDLVKRGGQRTSVTPYWFVDCAAWFFDWSDMPIFPYVVKADRGTVNPKNIHIDRKSHTVEEC